MKRMRPDVQELLDAARDTRAVKIVIRNLCAVHGEVAGTGVVCSARAPAAEITAFVEMKDKIAMKVAHRLGAGNVGTRLVVFRYPAPAGFVLPSAADAERRSARSLPCPRTTSA